MAEILNFLPPDILRIEAPEQIHKQEATTPAKPDDDGIPTEAVDALFSEPREQEEVTPAVVYMLWSGAAIIGEMARDHKRRDEGELVDDEDDEETSKTAKPRVR